MKEGWELLTIKECCDILDSRRKPITKSKREPGAIPYYGATGLLDYVKDYIFDEPLVLLGEDGAKWGAGECSAYRIEGKSWVNNHAHALRPKRDIVNDYWLIYFLNYSNLQSYITGVTVPKLNQEKMCSITLPAPPLSEQQRIVDYLDSAFAKIDAMKANAEKALNEAKALFQASLKEMLEPKDGWEEKKLGEVCNVVGGGTPDTKNQDYWNGNIPWATVSDMNCDILKTTGYYITEKGLNESSSRIIKTGEIIIATRVGLGKVCKLAVDTAINQDLKGIIPKNNNILRDFIFYYFKHKAKYIENNGIGATVKGVKIKFIEGLSIDFPSLPEQQSIVATLDSLKSKVDRLQANYDKISQECDALKQAILRQVFE